MSFPFLQNRFMVMLEEGKFQEKYIEVYLDFQQCLKRMAKIVAIVLTCFGFIAWKINKDFALIVFIISSGFQVCLLAEDLILRSNEEIQTIKTMLYKYRAYNINIFKLFIKIHSEDIDDATLKIELNKLVQEKKEILNIESNISIKTWGFICKKAKVEKDLYIKQLAFNNNE